jgi:hypothetical protein
MLLGMNAKPASGQIIAPGLDTAPQNTYPNPQYYLALEIYREGDLATAAEAFDGALGRCRRDTNGRWIDAIPVHAMLGECFYQAGDLPAATEQFDFALGLAIQHRGWLSSLEWQDALVAAQRVPDSASRWAGGQIPGIVPLNDKMKLNTGSRDTEGMLRRGGTFESARLTTVDAVEIMRGLALAAYRRRVIFGPLSDQAEVVRQAIDATKYPQGLALPIPRALIGAMRGCEKFAAAQDDATLTDAGQTAVIGGAVHPLSPLVLLAAARANAMREQYAAAVPIALQAAVAASALRQPEFVGEAMMIAVGCVDEKASGALIGQATSAAAAHMQKGRLASVGCLLAAIEAASLAGDVNAAQLALSEVGAMLQRRDIVQPRLAAHGEYLTALVTAQAGGSFGLGEPSAIDAALTRMFTFTSGNGPSLRRGNQRRPGGTVPATPRLFQLGLVTAGVRNRGVGGKVVDEKLNQFAGDPPAEVWRADPVDAIAFQVFDRTPMIAAQIVSAVKRNAPTDLMPLVDSLHRSRFLNTQVLGGRVLQVRRLAAAEKTLLAQDSTAFIAKPPQPLSLMMDTLAAPVPVAGSNELAQRGQRLESLATFLALKRIVLPPTSPRPLTNSSDLMKLSKECGVLTLVDVGGTVVAVLVANEKVKTWNVTAAKSINSDIVKLLREIGVTGNRQASRLEGEATWKQNAAPLRRKLIPDEYLEDILPLSDLVIIPDGPLWYLPWELLPLGDENADLLGDKVAIRYAPTPGLAIYPVAYGVADRPTGFVSQLFFAPRDGDLNQQLIDQISEVLKTPVKLPGDPAVAANLIGDSIGPLAVFGVVTPNPANPLALSPAVYDAATPQGSLAAWMRFPSRVPNAVILPGYRTTASGTALGDGRELSMTLIAMHCAGVRDVVISRWPVGGESTSILMKEFLQELPFEGVQPAWRRAIQSLRQAPLRPEGEPLLGAKDQKLEELTGSHPIFWSGYLIDSPSASTEKP